MTIILVLHVVLMFSSLLATSLMALAAFTARSVNERAIKLNLVATIIGIVCGIVLITQNPLDARCAVLFAYTLAFGATYAYVRNQNQLLAGSES